MDLSPEMIDRARENAEARGLDAKYMLGDASDPALEPGSLDLIVSRWVVWNLPAPADAYRRWMLLLKPGGRFLVIDGNHYLHLFDERYAALHEVTAPLPGHAEKYVRGVDFTVMDRIAHSLPLSRIDRPAWDVGSGVARRRREDCAQEDGRSCGEGCGRASRDGILSDCGKEARA